MKIKFYGGYFYTKKRKYVVRSVDIVSSSVCQEKILNSEVKTTCPAFLGQWAVSAGSGRHDNCVCSSTSSAVQCNSKYWYWSSCYMLCFMFHNISTKQSQEMEIIMILSIIQCLYLFQREQSSPPPWWTSQTESNPKQWSTPQILIPICPTQSSRMLRRSPSSTWQGWVQ